LNYRKYENTWQHFLTEFNKNNIQDKKWRPETTQKNGAIPKSLMSRENKKIKKMKTNKILLGGIAGGIIFLLLGWLIYGVLLREFMMANSNQCAARPMQDMIWWAMILSNLAWGLVLSLVLSWSNTSTPGTGAKIAGITGMLFAASIDLNFYSMTTTISNVGLIAVDIVVYFAMSAIAGAVVALILGSGKK
jgi:hypothetical protein